MGYFETWQKHQDRESMVSRVGMFVTCHLPSRDWCRDSALTVTISDMGAVPEDKSQLVGASE